MITHLYRISGVDFTQIDGLGVLTVQTILSEVGLDPTRFACVKHFCSWLGLCPGSRITGGVDMSMFLCNRRGKLLLIGHFDRVLNFTSLMRSIFSLTL